jgi:hypothetical protein
MRPAVIDSPIFADNTRRNAYFSQAALAAGVLGLMLEDVAYLKFYPKTPDLYDSGVIYKPEEGTEVWRTIPYVIAAGWGDCEDLGAWRAAELRVRYGVKAVPHIRVRKLPSGSWRAHVVVRWPDGSIEDPSAKLGMYLY